MGSCLSFPAERRPRSLAATQAPLLHSPAASPALPFPTPTLGATAENYSLTHKDSHQQRHVPLQPLPGKEWPSGVPAAPTPCCCPFAGGTWQRRRRRTEAPALKSAHCPRPGARLPFSRLTPVTRHRDSRLPRCTCPP